MESQSVEDSLRNLKQNEAEVSCIKVALRDEWNIEKPHPIQMDSIRYLCFPHFKANDPQRCLCLVAKTGIGKSVVIYASASILGGVTIAVAPLQAIQIDQCGAHAVRY
jgi:superfamily II DNA helicase RecQ